MRSVSFTSKEKSRLKAVLRPGPRSTYQDSVRKIVLAGTTRGGRLRLQVIVAVAVLVGLFFVEYPPIFALGYWTWSGAVHKALTGVFLIVNLVIGQYVARRAVRLRAFEPPR